MKRDSNVTARKWDWVSANMKVVRETLFDWNDVLEMHVTFNYPLNFLWGPLWLIIFHRQLLIEYSLAFFSRFFMSKRFIDASFVWQHFLISKIIIFFKSRQLHEWARVKRWFSWVNWLSLTPLWNDVYVWRIKTSSLPAQNIQTGFHLKIYLFGTFKSPSSERRKEEELSCLKSKRKQIEWFIKLFTQWGQSSEGESREWNC